MSESPAPSRSIDVPEGTRGVVLLSLNEDGTPVVGYFEPNEHFPLPRRDVATMLGALAGHLRQQADALDYLAEEEA